MVGEHECRIGIRSSSTGPSLRNAIRSVGESKPIKSADACQHMTIILEFVHVRPSRNQLGGDSLSRSSSQYRVFRSILPEERRKNGFCTL